MAAHGVAWSSLPPKAPPSLATSTSIAFMGSPRTRAVMRCTAVGAWVEERILSRSPSCGSDQGGLGFQVEVLLAARLDAVLRRPRRTSAQASVDVAAARACATGRSATGGGCLAGIEDRWQLLDTRSRLRRRLRAPAAECRRPRSRSAGRRSGPHLRRAAARPGRCRRSGSRRECRRR